MQEKARYAKFLQEVDQHLNSITPQVSKTIRTTVEDTYNAVYTGMVDAVTKSVDNEELKKKLKGLSLRPEVMKNAIENPISGLTLPDTLEKHRKEVVYNIKQQINIGLMTGERYDTMAKNVHKVISGDNGTGGSYGKAMNIVRTESHRVQESGFMDSAEDVSKGLEGSGLVYAVIWRTMKDERVRPQVRIHTSKGWKTKIAKTTANHQKMEGKIAKVGDKFELEPGVFAKCPGSSGTARNDCNCRCYLEYELMTYEEFAKATGKSVAEVKKENGVKNNILTDDANKNVQNYKPVELSNENIDIRRKGKEIITHKILSANNDIYVSESVKLKPKQLHNIDSNVSKVANLLNVKNKANLPRIYIINNTEMQSGALASYNPVKNIMFFDEKVGIREELLKLQEELACNKEMVSTYLHEFIHWKDASEYRRKYGSISTEEEYNKYITWLNDKCKKELDKIGITEYYIDSISGYANRKYGDKQYDEVYTEYRVKKLLGGV